MAARLDPRLAVASLRGPYQIRPGSYSWVNGNTADELDNARRMVIECIDQVADSTGRIEAVSIWPDSAKARC